MNITVTVNGKRCEANLFDNATAQEFASLLPLRLSMSDLMHREKFASLPKQLTESAPRTSRYGAGDIGYWSPSHDLAIYYHDGAADRIPSPGIIPIGKIHSGIEAFQNDGNVSVLIERSSRGT